MIEPHGIDLSPKLADVARARLPAYAERIHTGNALYWDPPRRYDFVRTEMVYVPPERRRAYVERLLSHVVANDGRLLVCSYGSSRPEGIRSEPLVDELEAWGVPIGGVADVVSEEHGYVITRVVWLPRTVAAAG
jgi:hypothetical protein